MCMIFFMQQFDHAVGAGKPGRIKILATPIILLPVTPVKNDVIQWNFSLPEFLDCRYYFIFCLVTFPALPKTIRPYWQQRRFAGQRSVAIDYLVHVMAINEVIIQLFTGF